MVLATTTTDATGYYRFDNLPAGNYTVEVAIGNFAPGAALAGLASSQIPVPNPNADGDQDDEGAGIVITPTGIRSLLFLLGPTGIEPVLEPDKPVVPNPDGAPDPYSNLTIDFGFAPGYSIGNRVWRDDGAGAARDNGLTDAGEPGIAGVRVNLLDGAGAPVTDSLGNPIFTLTNATGYYRFDSVPSGSYILEIAASNFAAAGALFNYVGSGPTEANPNLNVDGNDNGLVPTPPPGQGVRSGVLTVGIGNTEPGGEPDGSSNLTAAAPDLRANLTVDFGFLPATVPTPVAPCFSSAPRIGDRMVAGIGEPSEPDGCLRVCWVGPNGIDENCGGDDVPLGTGGIDSIGRFLDNGQPVIYLDSGARPNGLLDRDRICVYDSCQPEPYADGCCALVHRAAPAPAMSPTMTILSLLMLTLIGAGGIVRLRRAAARIH